MPPASRIRIATVLASIGIMAVACSDLGAQDHLAAASATPEHVTPPPIPPGYELRNAPHAKVSFCAPRSWHVLTSQDINHKGMQKSNSKVAEVARELGTSEAKIRRSMAEADMYLLSSDPSHRGIVESITVDNQNYTREAGLPASESLHQALEENHGVTAGAYTTPSTPLGQAAQMEYTLRDGKTTAHGIYLVLPNGAGGYTTVSVSAAAPRRAQDLASIITTTLRAG